MFWLIYFTLCKRYLPSQEQQTQDAETAAVAAAGAAAAAAASAGAAAGDVPSASEQPAPLAAAGSSPGAAGSSAPAQADRGEDATTHTHSSLGGIICWSDLLLPGASRAVRKACLPRLSQRDALCCCPRVPLSQGPATG